jgi:hypothetical protein
VTREQHRRLLEIRKRSRLGGYLSPEDQAFCQKMHAKFPDEYREMERYIQRWAVAHVNPMAEFVEEALVRRYEGDGDEDD